ncbi:PAS domain S-box protein [Haloprofundus salilacus]|uniref:PAS domain S-box protein n=1 Tax=Haloprofundus salilacus TaxID=2876190 RepID=UPI001CC93C54|nr:PAS domain S-box protein [Haloprofundus salilacus]
MSWDAETDEPRTPEERARKLQRYESIIDTVGDGIYHLDLSGRFVDVNDVLLDVTGYSREVLIGESVSILLDDDDISQFASDILDLLREPAVDVRTREITVRVRDGRKIPVEVRFGLLEEDGEVVGTVGIVRDITERHEREKQLRRERDLLENVLETSPVIIGVFDAESRELVRANDAAVEVLGARERTPELGYSAGEIPVYDETGEPIPREERPYAWALERGEPVYDWQAQMEHPDGERRWYSINAMPLFDDDTVEQVVVVGDDITQLKRQAEWLRRERDELQSELDEVFARVTDAFYGLDANWTFTYVNDQAESLLARSANELVGSNVWEEFPEAVEMAFRTEYERAMRTQRPVSFEEYYPPLSTWFEVRAYPSKTGLSVYFQDVTERKGRESELERYETIVETVGDVVYVVDENQRFILVNRAAEELSGIPRERIIGRSVAEFIGEEAATQADELASALPHDGLNVATGEFELGTVDGRQIPIEARFTRLPTDHGPADRVGVARDITERKARERELELYETIVETVDDGIYAVDSDARFVFVNDSFCKLTGYDREELLGAHAATVHDAKITPRAERMATEIRANEREDATIELEIRRKDGEHVPVESRLGPFPMENGIGRCGVVRDVTEQIEHQRELQAQIRQQQVVTDLGQQALAERDLDALMATVVDGVADTLEMDYCKVLELHPEREELLLRAGVGWYDGLVGVATVETRGKSQAGYTLLSDEPVVVEDLDAETRFTGPDLLFDHNVTSGMSVIIGPPDDPWGILGTHDTERREFAQNDVNFLQSVANVLATAIERAEYERAMEESERRYRTLAEHFPNGGVALFDEELRYTLLEGAIVDEYEVSKERLLGTDVGDLSPNREMRDRVRQYCRNALDGETTRYEFEWNDRAFRAWAVPVVGESGEPFAGMLVTQEITDLRERERALEQQRERLAALNNLNAVAREITEAVINQSTREEIERTVCEALASSDSYLFSWIGDVDTETNTVHLREEAGVEGYLSDVTISIASDGSVGPTARAVQTKQTQVTQDIVSDVDYAQWRERAKAYGYRSSAAIPIVYEGSLYGVLNVYAARPRAFSAEESEVLTRLGEVIGHAITAIGRKHALTSDQVIEVGFEINDVFDELDLQTEAAGEITLDQAVPIGGGEYLVYGTVDGDDLDVVREIVERVPHWDSVRVLSEGFGRTKFELRLSEPPVLSAIASLGGYVKRARIENGDYYMGIQLPVTADVREFVETVQTAYPSAVLRSQRQVTRTDDSPNKAKNAFQRDLTDRQRAALESAYYAGFFEWPRESTGREVAESLGVSAPTFSQHLRKAENRIFGALFADSTVF